MSDHQENEELENINHLDEPREPATYNFKWMLALLIIGILGSFIFARLMK